MHTDLFFGTVLTSYNADVIRINSEPCVLVFEMFAMGRPVAHSWRTEAQIMTKKRNTVQYTESYKLIHSLLLRVVVCWNSRVSYPLMCL